MVTDTPEELAEKIIQYGQHSACGTRPAAIVVFGESILIHSPHYDIDSREEPVRILRSAVARWLRDLERDERRRWVDELDRRAGK